MAHDFLMANLRGKRGVDAVIAMYKFLDKLNEAGHRYADDATYEKMGFANRASFEGRVMVHAHMAFGDELKAAKKTISKGFEFTGLNIKDHPATRLERALGYLEDAECAILSDTPYLTYGETRNSFLHLLRQQRVDRINTTMAGLLTLPFDTDLKLAQEADFIVMQVWGDLALSGIEPDLGGRYAATATYNREYYFAAARRALRCALPVLMNHMRDLTADPHPKNQTPMRNWRTAYTLYQTVGVYATQLGNKDLKDLIGIDEAQLDSMACTAFANMIRAYIPRASKVPSWAERGFGEVLTWAEEIDTLGWGGNSRIDAALNHIGYASYADLYRKTALARVDFLIERSRKPDAKAHEVFSSINEAYDILFEKLNMDELDAYKKMGYTAKSFGKKMRELSAVIVPQLYDELHEPVISSDDTTETIEWMQACLGWLEDEEMPVTPAMIQYIDDAYIRASIRKIAVDVMNYLAALPTPEANGIFQSFSEDLLQLKKDGQEGLTIISPIVRQHLGLSKDDAEALLFRYEVLELQKYWLNLQNPYAEPENRYQNIRHFTSDMAARTPEDVAKITPVLLSQLGYDHWDKVTDQLGQWASETAKHFYTQLSHLGPLDRKERTKVLTKLEDCMVVARAHDTDLNDFTFLARFGFPKGAYEQHRRALQPQASVQTNKLKPKA